MSQQEEAVDTAPPEDAAAEPSGTGPKAPPGPADFDELVSAYETPLLRYARQIVGPVAGVGGAEAEDVVQETFLRLHRHVEREGGASVRNTATWLFHVTHNVALDSRRRKKAREGAHVAAARRLAEQEPDDSPEGLAAMIRRAACERAVEELQKLPAQQKHVLLLKVIRDMTLRDIAAVTGQSLSNVTYHLNQGLKELARRLKAAGVI